MIEVLLAYAVFITVLALSYLVIATIAALFFAGIARLIAGIMRETRRHLMPGG